MGYTKIRSGNRKHGYRNRKKEAITIKKPWHIIVANQGKQLEDVYSTDTEEKVNKRFNKLLKENEKNVKFPIRWNINVHDMYEADYELMIIKLKNDDPSVKEVRNENGDIVEYTSSSKNWVIYDTAPYNVEETFWVYGFHPQLHRKDYKWIYENFILKYRNDKTKLLTVAIFKNKLLIDSDDKLEMVICKNKSDSIRFYNVLEGDVKKDKIKNVIFMGDVWESKSRKYWYDKIANLTHWKWKKIIRHTTRP